MSAAGLECTGHSRPMWGIPSPGVHASPEVSRSLAGDSSRGAAVRPGRTLARRNPGQRLQPRGQPELRALRPVSRAVDKGNRALGAEPLAPATGCHGSPVVHPVGSAVAFRLALGGAGYGRRPPPPPRLPPPPPRPPPPMPSPLSRAPAARQRARLLTERRPERERSSVRTVSRYRARASV